MALKNNQLLLKLGVYDISDWGENVVKRDVENVYIHPNYKMSSIDNDIGILEFNIVTLNSNLIPICLWDGGSDLSKVTGKTGTVIKYIYHMVFNKNCRFQQSETTRLIDKHGC